MKINSLLFTVWMLFLTIPTVAQQPDARDILDRAADAFRKEGGVKITFSVRAPEGNTNGSIRLKGDKFLLETEGDSGVILLRAMRLMFPNPLPKSCRASIRIRGCRSISRIIS